MTVVAMAVTVTVARTRRNALAVAEPRSFQVTGVITAPVTDGRVMVAHDDIPGYMPATTMPFAVLGTATPPLAAGDRVRFTLSVWADRSQAGGFEVTGHDAQVAAALGADTRPSGTRLKKGDALPDFSLTTSDGRPLASADLSGQVTAITFVFTRCPVPEFCPLMVKRFQQVQWKLESIDSPHPVRRLSVTLDPAFDTPPVTARLRREHGSEPGTMAVRDGTTRRDRPTHIRLLNPCRARRCVRRAHAGDGGHRPGRPH